MTLPTNPSRPVPDYSKISRANKRSLRRVVPAFMEPTENANATLNKESATLGRAGSGEDNPILSGLGVRIQISLAAGDTLLGLWLFRDHADVGGNLVRQAAVAGRFATYDFMAGSGQTAAGTSATGAVRNFVRYQTKGGTKEKDFWIKTYQHDVVTVQGEACLDEATLDPVEVVATIVDDSRDWLDLPIDFLASWNDEFHVQHRRSDADVEAGFLKAYGGALVVSFFDTSTDEEGVGVQVNPVTQALIRNRRTIQVQNTEGLKEITVRFRSKTDSSFVVDVPILIRVIEPDTESCAVPAIEPCTDLYLPATSAIPEDSPGEASDPEVTAVAGVEGDVVPYDLLVVTVRGATVGASPVLRVRKWAWVESGTAMAGARLTQVGDDVDYLPLVRGGSSPDPGAPYGSPKRFTIAFSKAQLQADNVALLNIMIVDGDHVSAPVTVPGPQARAPMFFAPGGTGGGPTCAY